jgi:hypothetical protein
MKHAYIMTEADVEQAIDLFKEGDGMGTIARKMRDSTKQKITEAQVRKRLLEKGHYRTYEESKKVKT